MEPDLWDGNLCHISLHSLLEHLFSDAVCTKTSIVCIAKYIKNKKIKLSKANDIKDLQGIREAAWKLISAFYDAGWDTLIADVHNNSFRQKISYHCMPKTTPIKNSKLKGKDTVKLERTKRLPSLFLWKPPRRLTKSSNTLNQRL